MRQGVGVCAVQMSPVFCCASEALANINWNTKRWRENRMQLLTSLAVTPRRCARQESKLRGEQEGMSRVASIGCVGWGWSPLLLPRSSTGAVGRMRLADRQLPGRSRSLYQAREGGRSPRNLGLGWCGPLYVAEIVLASLFLFVAVLLKSPQETNTSS